MRHVFRDVEELLRVWSCRSILIKIWSKKFQKALGAGVVVDALHSKYVFKMAIFGREIRLIHEFWLELLIYL